MPAPLRGEIVRQFERNYVKNKEALGKLVSMKWVNHYKKDMVKCKK
jgi:hypothetical protein